LEKLKAKVTAGERDVRRTLKPLREVWLEVGIEKLDNHDVMPELKIPSKWQYKQTYGRIPTKWDAL